MYRPETALPPAGRDKVLINDDVIRVATRVDLKMLLFLLSHVRICMKLQHQESDQYILPRDQSICVRSSVPYLATFILLKIES